MNKVPNRILGRYTISLTRVSDQKTVEFSETFELPDTPAWKDHSDWEGTVSFLWGGGNYSCNCNRFLFFERALGKTQAEIDAIDPNGDCGSYENYHVNWIRNIDTGATIYHE